MILHLFRFTSLLCLVFNTGPLQADLVETFSGTGSFSASGGPIGFENPGWANLGAPGQFQSNSFGEQVYELSGNGGLNSLNRLVGNTAFSSRLEISNPNFSGGGAGARFGVVDGTNNSLFAFLLTGNGETFAGIAAEVDGSVSNQSLINLGSSVQRATFFLEFAPDLINGGGIFEAFVEVNEAGLLQSVGAVDGLVYTANAGSGRNLSLNVFGNSTVEFDHLTFNSVPEPASVAVLCLSGVALILSRRREE